jgi:signal transduction histidine kinase/CheY-like chemotaxis protein
MPEPSPPSAGTDARVLREQVAALYATMPASTAIDVLLAWGLCALLYWQTRDGGIFIWLGLHFIQVLRYPLIHAYFRDPHAAERSAFWARRHWRELLYYSITWGLAPWLFLPADSVPLTALVMLTMLGLCSGGVPSVAPRWPSVLAFIVPMTVGLITALAWRADTIHLFLAACAVLHVGATLHFAHAQHKLLTTALATRFEKEALADALAHQVQITQQASEEKTRFFAAASHDLRQPLHAVALFGVVLERELQGHASQPHAQRLMRAVNALSGSLDTMLDVSQLDAGVVPSQPQAVPLRGVLLAVQALAATRADARALQLRVRTTPLWVRTDPQLLQRLLVNLVENAIKYTPAGGVLVVARARGAEVWLDVVDTGVGIAPEHHERVFQEFYQVHNPGRDRAQGLGIGLSIVRRLSRLLDHPVELHSQPGRGSRFRVRLPRADAPAHVPTPAVAPARGLPAAALPRHVLLLDDEADITDALSAFLRGEGIATASARDELEAQQHLDRAAAAGQPFDALLCDYRLAAGADGLEAALRLHARAGSTPGLLLVTGETAPERLQRVHDSGVPVLFKPVQPERLLQALAELSTTSAGPAPSPR